VSLVVDGSGSGTRLRGSAGREIEMVARVWSKRLVLAAALAALGMFHLFCPWQIGVVSGASMEPSFRSHQIILIDRHYYRHHPLRRGDVIILRQDDAVLIKRVYGLGGDSFWTLFNADDGDLYREIIPPARLERMRRLLPLMPSYRLSRIKVPPGTVYVVGDNTTASVDSRTFGPVPLSAVLGRVTNAPPAAPEPTFTTVARG
jgi:signal peptidase I